LIVNPTSEDFKVFQMSAPSDGMLDALRKPPPIATRSSMPRNQQRHGRSGPLLLRE
jgi:hypothetical protein